MNLWKLYIKEREGADILCDEHSFLTYTIMDDREVFILDVFVEPGYRKEGLIKKHWNELMEKTNPSRVYTTTDITALNWEPSHKFVLSFGFTPYTQEGNLIYYYQEIS